MSDLHVDAGRRQPAAGATRMARLTWRTGRVGLVLGAVAVAAVVTAVASSVVGLYETARERAEYAATLGQSPATAAFNGRPHDLDRLGGIVVYEVGLFGLLLLPAVAMLLAIRHTRGQEDVGRADLVTASRIGRLAPFVGATSVVTLTLVVSGAAIALLLIAIGLPGEGAVRYAAVLVLYMLMAMGIALLAAELSQSARSASMLAFSVLGAMYLVRAVIDGRKWDMAAATPMGWLAESRPFADDPPWWPLAAMLALSLALVGGALFVRTRRDLGSGVIAPRPGPATGNIRGPVRLAWAVTHAPGLAWSVGAAAWGFGMGLLAEEMRELLASNPGFAQALVGRSETPDAIMTYIAAVLIGLMGGAVALQGVSRFAAEESSGRLGVLLSTTLGRLRWWTGAVFVVVAEVVLALTMGGLGYGLGSMLTGTQSGSFTDGLEATLAYGAPALLIASIAVLLLAFHHRLMTLGWLLLTWAAIVALLGDTLQLPTWARDLSPVEQLGQVPIVDVEPTVVASMLAAAALALVTALPLLRRRDLAAG